MIVRSLAIVEAVCPAREANIKHGFVGHGSCYSRADTLIPALGCTCSNSGGRAVLDPPFAISPNLGETSFWLALTGGALFAAGSIQWAQPMLAPAVSDLAESLELASDLRDPLERVVIAVFGPSAGSTGACSCLYDCPRSNADRFDADRRTGVRDRLRRF